MVIPAAEPSALSSAKAVALVLVAALLLAVGWDARAASADPWFAVEGEAPTLSAQESPDDGFYLPRAPALVAAVQPERPSPPPVPPVAEAEVAAWPRPGTPWLARVPPPVSDAPTGPRSPRTPTGPPDA